MKRLADLRNARGWSQEQLAKLSGVAQPSIARFETGEREPKLSHMRSLAKTFGMTLTEFVAGVVEDPPLDPADPRRSEHQENVEASDEAVGRRLKLLLAARGMEADVFCKMVEIEPERWRAFEAGDAHIPIRAVLRISQRTGAPATWIYFGERTEVPEGLLALLDKASAPESEVG